MANERILKLVAAADQFEKVIKELAPYTAAETSAIRKFLAATYNRNVAQKKEETNG